MNMEQWARVRRKVLVDGRSKRSVMSEEGLHWETLQKMLSHSGPPGEVAPLSLPVKSSFY